MEPIKAFESRIVVLPIENIDTDQIIPARYLKTTNKSGLGDALFSDWRYNADGSPKNDFVLNQTVAAGAEVLVAGNNFGCGSSREHAPWALQDYGFKAVVSTEIADIFRNNSLKNGLVPVIVDEATHQWLLANPGAEVEIDLETTTLNLPNGTKAKFPMEPFPRYCIMNGVDELGFILSKEAQIAAYEARRPRA